jgi:uncharacterized protein YbjT (DUF2867 family)
MNLIVGATGILGGEICRLLAEKGEPVRALVRSTSNPEKVAQLKALKAEVVIEDLKDRRSLDAACRGATAVIYGSGSHKISWISFQDVAKFAVAALDPRLAPNAIVELGGPEALSPLEAVRLAEQVVGKPIEVQHVPEEALRAQHGAATDSLQQSFAGLMLYYAGGDVIEMADTLRTFPIQPLKSVRAHFQGIG